MVFRGWGYRNPFKTLPSTILKNKILRRQKTFKTKCYFLVIRIVMSTDARKNDVKAEPRVGIKRCVVAKGCGPYPWHWAMANPRSNAMAKGGHCVCEALMSHCSSSRSAESSANASVRVRMAVVCEGRVLIRAAARARPLLSGTHVTARHARTKLTDQT